MKKRMVKGAYIAFVIGLLAALLLQVSSSSFAMKTVNRNPEQRSSFPASLQYISEEAFDNTALEVVSFGNELIRIDERAFFGADKLTAVYIPPSVEYIGDHAFPLAVTVHGAEGSCAQTWAEENGLNFVADDIWNAPPQSSGIHPENLLCVFWMVAPVDEKALFKLKKRVKAVVKSMRPQERPELYPINYRFP